jgi:hypothetical protein
MILTSKAACLRPNRATMPRSTARKSLVVRMQGAHAAAPPASGEIKDKNAELAINGTFVECLRVDADFATCGRILSSPVRPRWPPFDASQPSNLRHLS